MTRDEILAMQPGRELDALIAEKVMGAPNNDYWFLLSGPRCYDKDGNGVEWNPSTDISAAWEVVEELQNSHLYMDIRTCADFYEVWITINETTQTETVATPRLPEAIAKCALLAVMDL